MHTYIFTPTYVCARHVHRATPCKRRTAHENDKICSTLWVMLHDEAFFWMNFPEFCFWAGALP